MNCFFRQELARVGKQTVACGGRSETGYYTRSELRRCEDNEV
jgi:hypothetical protein